MSEPNPRIPFHLGHHQFVVFPENDPLVGKTADSLPIALLLEFLIGLKTYFQLRPQRIVRMKNAWVEPIITQSCEDGITRSETCGYAFVHRQGTLARYFFP